MSHALVDDCIPRHIWAAPIELSGLSKKMGMKLGECNGRHTEEETWGYIWSYIIIYVCMKFSRIKKNLKSMIS